MNTAIRNAQVMYMGALDMQVCVPENWTDEQVVEFAQSEYECGTANGWQIRRDGHPALAGAPSRVECAARDTYVHIMLDA